ncbi:MAG: hypothetical protein ACLQU5_33905 [Isosphaeraceae bacterium]|jgi:hypothetical protein
MARAAKSKKRSAPAPQTIHKARGVISPRVQRVGPEQVTESDLKRVIEPLASYLCATDQPRAALMAALAVLFREVDQTYRAANAQITTFSGNQWS